MSGLAKQRIVCGARYLKMTRCAWAGAWRRYAFTIAQIDDCAGLMVGEDVQHASTTWQGGAARLIPFPLRN